jgi:zinc D-Ala-D-Ala dipeptidase
MNGSGPHDEPHEAGPGSFYKSELPQLDPAWVLYSALPQLDPSENWVEIVEDRDPLVRIDNEIPCLAAQWRRGWPGTHPHTFARQRVALALTEVRLHLPAGLDLIVLDAYRSMETQHYLYQRAYSNSDLPPGFVADPSHATIVPPHTTGAAIDVTLAFSGKPLALGTAPGQYEELSELAALESTEGTAKELRRVLYHHMTAAGFCGIKEEWWHYSIGDQEWAHQKALSAACYGPVDRPA